MHVVHTPTRRQRARSPCAVRCRSCAPPTLQPCARFFYGKTSLATAARLPWLRSCNSPLSLASSVFGSPRCTYHTTTSLCTERRSCLLQLIATLATPTLDSSRCGCGWSTMESVSICAFVCIVFGVCVCACSRRAVVWCFAVRCESD